MIEQSEKAERTYKAKEEAINKLKYSMQNEQDSHLNVSVSWGARLQGEELRELVASFTI
jgi:hypothetical protein